MSEALIVLNVDEIWRSGRWSTAQGNQTLGIGSWASNHWAPQISKEFTNFSLNLLCFSVHMQNGSTYALLFNRGFHQYCKRCLHLRDVRYQWKSSWENRYFLIQWSFWIKCSEYCMIGLARFTHGLRNIQLWICSLESFPIQEDTHEHRRKEVALQVTPQWCGQFCRDGLQI